jgi:hypothetical protein
VNKIYIGSDHDVELLGVKSRAGGGFINSATAVWVLSDGEDGSTISTGTIPYVASSDGDYRGVIDRSVTLGLVEGEIYYVTAVLSGGGNDLQKRSKLLAAYDQEDCG